MRVLGIDPGTRITGWGLVEKRGNGIVWIAHGVVRAKPSLAIPERLRQIYEGLEQVVATHSPQWAAVEEAFYGKNVRAAIKIGEARGVALLCAARAGVQIAEYSPAVIKKAVVGSGRAHKSQVQEMVRVILGLAEPPAPEDASDALAMAICHCHRHADALTRAVLGQQLRNP